MDDLTVIWLLAIGLGLACIFGYAAHKVKLSPILGYLVAGYLLGPNSPGFVADTQIAEQLASIGVTLLMFAVGLNFNWKDLLAVRKIALPGALTLSAFSIVVGSLYVVYLGETLLSGFVVGVAICVSSTVVIVRVLSDRGILHTPQGHIVVGWTIVEDLISVFGLLILPALVRSGASADAALYPLVWVLIKIVLLGVLVYVVGERLIEQILKVIARTRSHELFTLVILAVAFFFSFGTSYFFGVSLALGAFIAGTIVGRTEMSHQAAANALPMRDAFAVIFFLSVGMLFSPVAVTHNLSLFIGILVILLLLRPLLAFLIVKIARYPFAVALTVALAIAQIGEYSFILAEEGSNLGILPDNAYDILVACAFITIGLNPILFQLVEAFGRRILRGGRKNSSKLEELSIEKLQERKKRGDFFPRAIVIGFGPVGRRVSEYLSKSGYAVLVIERNIDTVTSLKSSKTETIFGDATQFSILERAQIDTATLLVITTPDFSITHSIVETARGINPFIKIVARTRFAQDA
ncbi:MAG: cation:proton antiporter, partial [Chlamydiia bacterium]|nr:cation:proton antiporter [Chlamydiia bacterium]